MSKTLFRLILITVVFLLAILFVWAWWNLRTTEPSIPPVEERELEEVGDSDTSQTDGNLFEIDEGVRVSFGSNPLVLSVEPGHLTLAYESREDEDPNQELKRSPQEKVRVVTSGDGITFESASWSGGRVSSIPLEMPNGSFRRYVYEPESGGVVSYSSEDAEAFVKDEGLRYVVEGDGSAHVFGVWTTFVDSSGGVVLLYNVTDDRGNIVVNRAYASDGMTFELTDEGILNGTLEEEHYADPHTFVRENGDIWLVIMNQSTTVKPPLSREGIIYAYVSRDDGETFKLEGRLVGWNDFKEFEVYSLNDPKLVEFPDGTLRVYVAAMIKDGSMEKGFRWDLVSAHD